MANLFPVETEDDVIRPDDLKSSEPVGYRNGLAFDYQMGDFPRDGMNKILDSDGVESWKSWCINCLRTERYKHLAYSTDFGIDIDDARNASSRDEAESILSREISEAIMADPYGRTAYVEEIVFDWTAPDTVCVTVTIHGIDDVTIDVTAYISKGEG